MPMAGMEISPTYSLPSTSTTGSSGSRGRSLPPVPGLHLLLKVGHHGLGLGTGVGIFVAVVGVQAARRQQEHHTQHDADKPGGYFTHSFHVSLSFFRDDFSAQWSPPCIIVFLAKPEEKIFNFVVFLSLGRLFLPDKSIVVIIACISSIFNSEILFSSPLFRLNILRYTARYEPS